MLCCYYYYYYLRYLLQQRLSVYEQKYNVGRRVRTKKQHREISFAVAVLVT